MNEEEVAANFSFLSVEDMDGKDVGLIRKQRKMAEGSLMDSVSCKVFVWGLNDRQQLGSSQPESKVSEYTVCRESILHVARSQYFDLLSHLCVQVHSVSWFLSIFP